MRDYLAAARAASMITFATASGLDTIGTWLVGTSVVVAPIFFASARCAPGSIMRSWPATMYHDGLPVHAATLTGCSKFAPRIVDLDLGGHDGIPWSCTDLALLDDGDLLASAVLEDTRDAYEDGACLGSALVRMAPDGTPRWHRQLDTNLKVEGVAVDGETVWLVSDADDRAVPSQLLRATLA